MSVPFLFLCSVAVVVGVCCLSSICLYLWVHPDVLFFLALLGKGSYFTICVVFSLSNGSYPNSYLPSFFPAVSDEMGLQHVAQELEAKAILPFSFEK